MFLIFVSFRPGVANVAGNPPGAQQGRGKTWRRGAGWGSVRSGGRLLAGKKSHQPRDCHATEFPYRHLAQQSHLSSAFQSSLLRCKEVSVATRGEVP